jgi:hypothetical protein
MKRGGSTGGRPGQTPGGVERDRPTNATDDGSQRRASPLQGEDLPCSGLRLAELVLSVIGRKLVLSVIGKVDAESL